MLTLLPQDIFLIDDTITKNIALGSDDKKIKNSSIEKALKNAKLFDFVKVSTKGFKTILGERGVKLSGGQRQKSCNRKIILL